MKLRGDILNDKLKEKMREAVFSVFPITAIVLLICFSIAPVSSDTMMLFLVGAVFLVVGMGFFSLGAETSMSILGERVGANLSKSKKIWLIALLSFVLGMMVTIAEPDLQVLATQITEVPNVVLISTVGIGVGIFLVIAMLRMVWNIKLSRLLVFFYGIVFVLSFFVPESFLPLAFDAGGVTTGPLTVPFIIALGIGAASIRGNKNAESDSFGLVALCSIGPILSVMILGLLFQITHTEYTPMVMASITNSKDISSLFFHAIPQECKEVLLSLLPIIVFFGLYQVIRLKLSKTEVIKILVGFGYTFVGLVVFLTGVNVGFLPVGNSLGMTLMSGGNQGLIFPIMMLIGYFVVKAEPAVIVLTKQVNTITDGMVSEKLMKVTLSIGMAVALMISVARACCGIPIYYFLIPGYLLAMGLMFVVPEVFIGIAFDAGGVTSGPMTASFLLPMMIGITEASTRSNADIMQDAFGLVSMVAMMPLITIQLVGWIYKIKSRSKEVVTTDKEKEEIIVFPKKVKKECE